MRERASAIAVDLGGTKVEAAVVTEGNVERSVVLPTLASEGPAKVLSQICAAIDSLDAGRLPIGIGSPGPLDSEKGIILNTPNLPLRKYPLAKKIAARYHVEVKVDNDAKCFALGEARFGKGKGYRHVVGIILGTGVGGGFVTDGKLYHGKGNASEFGHMSIAPGPRCTCGNLGCLEEYASGRAILRDARSLGLRARDASEVFALAKGRGREAANARKAYAVMGGMLGVGMLNVIHALDPDIIVFGGGVSKASRLFMPAMLRVVRERCIVAPPRFAVSTGPMALLGAASLVLS